MRRTKFKYGPVSENKDLVVINNGAQAMGNRKQGRVCELSADSLCDELVSTEVD